MKMLLVIDLINNDLGYKIYMTNKQLFDAPKEPIVFSWSVCSQKHLFQNDAWWRKYSPKNRLTAHALLIQSGAYISSSPHYVNRYNAV